MSATDRAKLAEIDNNLERFLELLPELLEKHPSEYVLMHQKNIIGYFKSAIDAQIAGNRKFEDSIFSIQHIMEPAEELGYFSHAIHTGEA
ncbi:MAG TPA: hypothetical protein VNW90_30370 [Acetobacteraceae bacterium]|jgi:hypothetical protein|nr:hypothetical protein [Acetobacteraceae bacterium]